jgi:hypothetical protein
MPGSGTRTFLKPDHYEASLRQTEILPQEPFSMPRSRPERRITGLPEAVLARLRTT